MDPESFVRGGQGSKIVLVRSHLRVSQAAGQVNILIFLLKIKFSPYANKFCDAGQVPFFRYFEAWGVQLFFPTLTFFGGFFKFMRGERGTKYHY